MKKKQNIYKFFIKMIFIFLVFLLLQQILSSILLTSMKNERYGEEALFEIIWAGFVLLLLLLYKNRYIFTEKRETFKNGFKYVVPEVIMSCIFLLISIVSISTSSMSINIFSIINLLILCIFIGIVEEFLCRGWLLNEFLERFSKNKKEILLSIIFSSLVFGLIHFFNIGESQNFIHTFVQVLNATASGIFFALVYYKTKNIWLVVFSHAFWDFSLMLMEHNQFVDCYNEKSLSNNGIILNIIGGIILLVGYLIISYWLYRKTDLYSGNDKNDKNVLIIIGIGIYLIGLFGGELFTSKEDEMTCPIYHDKKIGSEYSQTFLNYKDYELNIKNETNLNDNDEDYNFVLTTNNDEDKVIFENKNINSSVVLFDDIYQSYLLVENNDSFIIVIQNSSNTVLYGRYLKSEVKNDKAYLNKIKSELTEYHVPNIRMIRTINIKNNAYNYVMIETTINKPMIFDVDDVLYFAVVE